MIPVQTNKSIKINDYQNLFKYLVYDGYRPQNIGQARDYVDFIVRDPETIDNQETPQHFFDYLNQEIKTTFPPGINEDYILSFD